MRKFMILFSGIALATIFNIQGTVNIRVLSIFISVGILFYIINKTEILEWHPFHCSSRTILSILLTGISLIFLGNYFIDNMTYMSELSNDRIKLITILLQITAFPTAYLFINYILICSKKWLKNYSQSLDKDDYVIMGSILIVFMIGGIWTYSKTNLFSWPTFNGEHIAYDVVYTLDTPEQIKSNVFLNITAQENDIRQPLFGLFAYPFALISILLTKIFFFVPNSFSYFLMLMQVIALLLVTSILAKHMELKKISKISFYLICFFSYAFLLFSLNVEQYVFSIFWLILYIDSVLDRRAFKDIFFIGATGSLLTSGITFGMLSDIKNFTTYVKDILFCAIKFFAVTTFAGVLPVFLNAVNNLQRLLVYTGKGKLTIYDQWMQFTNFISSCFIKPTTIINLPQYTYPSYQLSNVTEINRLGVVILCVCILGFILNWKKPIIKVCFSWLLYSILILVVIGLGAPENGMVLYGIYFGWSFLVLFFMAIQTLLSRWPKVQHFIYTLICLCLASINIPGILDLIYFGIQYYPRM